MPLEALLRGVAIGVMTLSSPVLAASDALQIRNEELPRAIIGQPYRGAIDLDVDGRCPMDGIHISVAKGRLPEGLRMAFETIQGTPKELGLFRFDLRVDNACASVTKPLQLLVTGRPILEVFPLTIAMTVAAGKVATESFLVSSSWPELPYSVLQAGAPWLSIRQTAGATPPRGSALIADRVTMRVDASKLPPGIYREKLTMYAWEGANAPTVEVAVTVEAAK